MLDQTSRIGCDCVISGGDWQPCHEHDVMLATAEATGGVELDRVPLADAGYSLLRMPGSGTRHPGAWRQAPERSTRPVTYSVPDVVQGWPSAPSAIRVVQGAFVRLDEPRYPRLAEIVMREALVTERVARESMRAATIRNASHESRTTRESRKARPDGVPRARPRTQTQMNDITAVHIERTVVDETPDMERLTRLANALAVGGDTWADRQG